MKHLQNIMLGMALAAGSLTAFGWGQKGHDTVTAIAERHFTPATKAAVDSLLDGMSIVYWANWLDNASHTPEYAYSKTWHYKNIDADENYESAPLHEKGDIVRAIYDQVDVLKSDKSTADEKTLALKMLVHFLGDIHQPMHLGHQSDLGGNRWDVRHFRRDTNLHSVWDSALVESAHKWSYTEWADQIDRLNPEETVMVLENSNPDKWAEESFAIATSIYNSTPRGTNIEYDYISNWTPVVEGQLLKGGLRLADLLNTVFDPEYKGGYTGRPAK